MSHIATAQPPEQVTHFVQQQLQICRELLPDSAFDARGVMSYFLSALAAGIAGMHRM